MNTVSCRIMGGLGNYLFQIATTFAISKRDNKKMIIDTSDNMVPHKPYKNYTDNIFRNIEFTTDYKGFTRVNENGFNYSDIPYVEGNTKLFGYFQSEKYFKNYRKEILDLFSMDENTKNYNKENYSTLLEGDTCSIHVRRGDYVRLSHYHYLQNIDYYKSAYEYIGKEKKYLIFSDDIEWCKKNLNFIENSHFIEGNTDYQDLYLMSLCKNNITCNSTFSWWGAWLNNNDNIVTIPSRWFGPQNSHLPTEDLYCDGWIKL